MAARHDPEVSWTNEVATDSAVEAGDPESSGKNEEAQIDGETQPILEKVGNGLFLLKG